MIDCIPSMNTSNHRQIKTNYVLNAQLLLWCLQHISILWYTILRGLRECDNSVLRRIFGGLGGDV
jgi:hypothetical protein